MVRLPEFESSRQVGGSIDYQGSTGFSPPLANYDKLASEVMSAGQGLGSSFIERAGIKKAKEQQEKQVQYKKDLITDTETLSTNYSEAIRYVDHVTDEITNNPDKYKNIDAGRQYIEESIGNLSTILNKDIKTRATATKAVDMHTSLMSQLMKFSDTYVSNMAAVNFKEGMNGIVNSVALQVKNGDIESIKEAITLIHGSLVGLESNLPLEYRQKFEQDIANTLVKTKYLDYPDPARALEELNREGNTDRDYVSYDVLQALGQMLQDKYEQQQARLYANDGAANKINFDMASQGVETFLANVLNGVSSVESGTSNVSIGQGIELIENRAQYKRTQGPEEHGYHAYDYAMPTGTSIKASMPGEVIYAGPKGNYGNTVIVGYKGTGITVLYAHLSTVKVGVKQVIQPGELLGLSGSTGHSTGPHLHIEIRKDGKPITPDEFDAFVKSNGQGLNVTLPYSGETAKVASDYVRSAYALGGTAAANKAMLDIQDRFKQVEISTGAAKTIKEAGSYTELRAAESSIKTKISSAATLGTAGQQGAIDSSIETQISVYNKDPLAYIQAHNSNLSRNERIAILKNDYSKGASFRASWLARKFSDVEIAQVSDMLKSGLTDSNKKQAVQLLTEMSHADAAVLGKELPGAEYLPGLANKSSSVVLNKAFRVLNTPISSYKAILNAPKKEGGKDIDLLITSSIRNNDKYRSAVAALRAENADAIRLNNFEELIYKMVADGLVSIGGEKQSVDSRTTDKMANTVMSEYFSKVSVVQYGNSTAILDNTMSQGDAYKKAMKNFEDMGGQIQYRNSPEWKALAKLFSLDKIAYPYAITESKAGTSIVNQITATSFDRDKFRVITTKNVNGEQGITIQYLGKGQWVTVKDSSKPSSQDLFIPMEEFEKRLKEYDIEVQTIETQKQQEAMDRAIKMRAFQ